MTTKNHRKSHRKKFIVKDSIEEKTKIIEVKKKITQKNQGWPGGGMAAS